MTIHRPFSPMTFAGVLVATLMYPLLVVPALSETPGPREIGCFADNRNADPLGIQGRDLDGAAFKDASMTVGKCLQLCADQDFDYVGLQNGSWCFCGNTYGKYKTGPASCTTKCAGDLNQVCGGEWANNIWQLSTPLADAARRQSDQEGLISGKELAVALQESLKSLRCYTLKVDGDWGRGSRAAVQRFNAISGLNLPADSPTEGALAAVSSWGGGNCRVTATRKTPRVRAKKRTSRPKKKRVTMPKKTQPRGNGSLEIIIRGPGRGLGIPF